MAEKKSKWIKKATENAHGQFREKAEHAGKTTREFAAEHAHDGGKLGKEAVLAENLMKASKHRRMKKMPSKMYK